MCLSKLEVFEPCEEGYQVKRKISEGIYGGLYYSNVRNMKPNIPYKAKRVRIRSTLKYTSGFHVFHNYKDAQQYRRSNYACWLAKTVIVKVKTGGTKITGRQFFYTRLGPNATAVKTIQAPVTVCSEITILEEVNK